jgi:RNA polymerase sigma factor (sigma-70 family)
MAHDSSRLGPDELLAHASGLRRLAVRLVGDSAADDLVQDTLLVGLQRPPLRAESTWPWLTRVMKNVATMRWRAESVREQRERAVSRDESAPSVDEWVARMELQRIVAEEVLKLPDPYRAALLAFYFDGVQAEEHARRRGVPAATVRSQLKRGIDMLRARLDARAGGERESWHAALVALARPETAVIGSGTIVGVVVMTKVLVGVAALLLIGLGFWLFGEGPSRGGAPASLSSANFDSRLARIDEGTSVVAPETPQSTRQPLADAIADMDPKDAGLGAIEGRVFLSTDNSHAANIGVSLCSTRNALWSIAPQQITDERGEFRFTQVEPGEYDLQLDRCNPPVRILVEAGKTAHASLSLPNAKEVRGHVFDENDAPVAGAEVWIVDPNGRGRRVLATTDEQGAFALKSVGPQSRILARKEGFAQSGTQSFGMFTGTLYLQRGAGRLTGSVRDASGAPIANAVVKVKLAGSQVGSDRAGRPTSPSQRGPIATGIDGSFAADALSPGSNTFSVDAQGFASWSGHADIAVNETRTVGIVLERAVPLDAVLLDERGAGFSDVRLQVTQCSTGKVFDAVPQGGGRYTFESLSAGDYDGYVYAKGRDDLRERVHVGSSRTVWSPKLSKYVALRGRILDADGRPVANQFVIGSTMPGVRCVPTDAGGWFEFPACFDRAQTLSLSAKKDAYWGTLAYWTDVQPSAPDIELRMGVHAPIHISGKLVDADGSAFGGKRLWAGSVLGFTDEFGRFELSGMQPGRTLIMFSRNNRVGEVISEIELHEGESRDLGTIGLGNTGSLQVRVHGVDGLPLEWVSVRLENVDRCEPVNLSAIWEGHTSFRFQDVRAGEYYLAFLGSSIARSRMPVHVDAGRENVFDVTLEFGTFVRIVAQEPQNSSQATSVTIEVRDARGALVDRVRERKEFAGSCTHDTLLVPGAYTVDVADDRGLAGHASFEVRQDRVRDQAVEVQLH